MLPAMLPLALSLALPVPSPPPNPLSLLSVGALQDAGAPDQEPSSRGGRGRREEGRSRESGRLSVTPRKEEAAVLTRCLTWLTGTGEENDYVSVGRLANYFGFVHFRISSGHTVDRAGLGGAVVDLLRPEQVAVLLELNRSQEPQLVRVREARVRMNDLLETMLDEGAEPAEQDLVLLGREFGREEALLGGTLARAFSEVAASLDDDQRAALRDLRERAEAGRARDQASSDGDTGGDTGGARRRRPRAATGQVARRQLEGATQDQVQEFWSLATRLLTWLTGTPEKNDFDTAGKPSQHFGFVSLRVESGHAITRGGVSEAVQEVLGADLTAILEEVVRDSREDFDGFFAARAGINRELERGLAGAEIRDEVLVTQGQLQGETEARMTWRQALAFLDVRDELEDAQALALLDLRERYLDLPSPEEVAQDPLAAGRRLVRLCALCHVPQGEGRAIGPSLEGIVGRRVGSVPGYTYSAAMQALGARGATWTEDELSRFIASPREHLPGTAMGFRGLPDPALRGALVRFLAGGQGAGEAASESQSAEQAPEAPSAEREERRRRAHSEASSSARPERPNILFLLSDDQPWDGLSVPMDPAVPQSSWDAVQTPALAKLAAEGMRLARAYSPSPVCSPTRASLQTGKSPGQLGWTKAAPVVSGPSYRLIPGETAKRFSSEEVTVAERLAAAGYDTAHFGKWHLEGGGPGEHGYRVHDGETGNNDAAPHTDPNPVDIFGMVERTEAFMREARDAGRPFFAQLSFHALHYPENASAHSLEAVRPRLERANPKELGRAALTQDLDEGVARLLATLETLELADRTFVLYMSDNGAKPNAGLLEGGKGDLWEAGIRVPLLVRGPGIEPGSVSRVPVAGFDLFPTFLEWAGDGGALPAGVEGGSLARLLAGDADSVERPQPFLAFHFPHYQGLGGPQSALIQGDRKLMWMHEGDELRLFDVARDPGERAPLEDPAEQERLGVLLRQHLEQIGARMPVPNPAFDPEASAPERKRGRAGREAAGEEAPRGDRREREGGGRGGRGRGNRGGGDQ
jgi:arylsulfatase A